ncbi:MAG: hypothetical protein U0800_15705 [Isosphaeraceae bacterium]
MSTTCPKCGSDQILPDVPIVTNVDTVSAAPVLALAYRKPGALVFKNPAAHRFLARICAACGFAEFYVEDPKGLAKVIREAGTGHA